MTTESEMAAALRAAESEQAGTVSLDTAANLAAIQQVKAAESFWPQHPVAQPPGLPEGLPVARQGDPETHGEPVDFGHAALPPAGDGPGEVGATNLYASMMLGAWNRGIAARATRTTTEAMDDVGREIMSRYDFPEWAGRGCGGHCATGWRSLRGRAG